MKKALKFGLAAAAGAAALTALAGKVTYESALNIGVARKLTDTFHLNDPEVVKWFDSDYSINRIDWTRSFNAPDSVIKGVDGSDIHAMIIKNPSLSHKWAVCVHGFLSQPEDMGIYGKEYYEMGYNLLFPCMRGHAEDSHKHCSMGWYDRFIVVSWVNYIVALDPCAQIVIHGVSMGAATTMLATGEELPENVKCAVSDCGYTSFKDEYAHEIRDVMHLPVFPILQAANVCSELSGNFDFSKCSPYDAVAHSKTPTLFIHGNADTFVPYKMLAEVYGNCSAPKRCLTVDGAPHAVSVMVNPKLYWDTLKSFLSDYISD